MQLQVHLLYMYNVSLTLYCSQKKEENILDDTRKFPLLDRSSMLRDSLEDFESPKRFITYNMLTDAKKPKKTRGRAARKKKAVTHSDNNSEDEVRKRNSLT